MPSPVIPSPNMLLPVPQVGIDTGPDWATQINNCMARIDSHNHSPGQGVLIDYSGISLSGDLPFNIHSATFLLSTQYSSQSSTLGITNGVYVVAGDLWFNNGTSTPVQITTGGSIVGTSGSISGLVSPASASYNAGTDTFIWRSNTGPNAANMDTGSLTIRALTSGSDGVTVNPPASIPSSGYNLQLPLASTANNNFVTMNTDGTMNSNIHVDGVTTQIVGNNLTAIAPRGSPTVFSITVGTTITTPAGATWARARLVGGGGGGGGGGAGIGGGSNGTNGGYSSFSNGTDFVTAGVGLGGTRDAGAMGTGGGVTSGGAVTIVAASAGSCGQGGITGYNGAGAGTGGVGGASVFGGAGFGGVAGQAGGNAGGIGSGGGGGGAGGGTSYYGGGGGGAGAYVEAIFYSLTASYTVVIGAQGLGGAAGTGGFKGGNGLNGGAIIEFYYN